MDTIHSNPKILDLVNNEFLQWLKVVPPFDTVNNWNKEQQFYNPKRGIGYFDIVDGLTVYPEENLTEVSIAMFQTKFEFENKNSWNKYFYGQWFEEYCQTIDVEKKDSTELYNWVAQNKDRLRLIVYFKVVDGVVNLIYKIVLIKITLHKYNKTSYRYHSFNTLREELFNIPPPFHFHLNNSINYCLLNIGNENEPRKNQGYS